MKSYLLLSLIACTLTGTIIPSSTTQNQKIDFLKDLIRLRPEFLQVLFSDTGAFGSNKILIEELAHYLIITRPDFLTKNPLFFIDIQGDTSNNAKLSLQEVEIAATGGLAAVLAKLKAAGIAGKTILAKVLTGITTFIAAHPFVILAGVVVLASGTVYYIYQSRVEAARAECLRGALNKIIKLANDTINKKGSLSKDDEYAAKDILIDHFFVCQP